MTLILTEVERVCGVDGVSKLRCHTHPDHDGSVWECSPDGMNWVKIELGINDLRESLNKHINETKTN